MSRLTDLIAQAKAKDTQLGVDLEREIRVLSRLPFGLNFERHSPEAVELPLRPVRKGDKVRVLPRVVLPRKAISGYGKYAEGSTHLVALTNRWPALPPRDNVVQKFRPKRQSARKAL